MLEILTLSLALQGALFIVVRLAAGHCLWPVDVLAPANIEISRKALQWAFIVYGLLWLLACMAHVAASTIHTSFYLEFGPWRASWKALLMLQSLWHLFIFAWGIACAWALIKGLE